MFLWPGWSLVAVLGDIVETQCKATYKYSTILGNILIPSRVSANLQIQSTVLANLKIQPNIQIQSRVKTYIQIQFTVLGNIQKHKVCL